MAGEPEAPAAQEPAFIEADAVLEAAPLSFELPPLEPTPPPPPAPALRHRRRSRPGAGSRSSAATSPGPQHIQPARARTRASGCPLRKLEASPCTRTRGREARGRPAATARRGAPTRGAGSRRQGCAREARTRRHAAGGTRRAGQARWMRPVGIGAAAALLVGGLGFGALKLFGNPLRLEAVEPTRLRVGQRATLTGSGFGTEPKGVTVVFGDREARVLQAAPKRLEVEVPESIVAAGAEGRVSVVVRANGRTSGVIDVAVFQGPRLHGISPGAAMPGEEVMLAGAGWGIGATVQFGSVPAQVLEVQATQIRALVPELPGGPGTEAPVTVSVGGVESNHAPFILGHLPVLSGLNPREAAPGDVVSLSGRGFETIAPRNDVRVGGVPALVIASSNDSLQFVVPRLGPGEAARAIELRVPGSTNVGQTLLQLKPSADPIDFRFVAEPFAPGPGRMHALLATGIGPAFVLASSGGMTAAERAAVAADRLNAAAQPLRTTVGLTVEARGLESNPVIGLVGRPEPLLEVTEEDAAAYNEDWTGLRGRGGPVTRARLARWWEALARDLVLLTVRAQAPQYTAALAPEGRALVQLFEIAQRSGAAGVPRRVVDEARPPLPEGLRILGLRVPASVTPPSEASAAAAALPAAAATPTPPPLQLDGNWGGSQVEQGQRQYLTVTVKGSGGTVAYEGGITFTVPMMTLEKPRRDQVRFSVQIRGGMRHYAGHWDGEAISGNVSTRRGGQERGGDLRAAAALGARAASARARLLGRERRQPVALPLRLGAAGLALEAPGRVARRQQPHHVVEAGRVDDVLRERVREHVEGAGHSRAVLLQLVLARRAGPPTAGRPCRRRSRASGEPRRGCRCRPRA